LSILNWYGESIYVFLGLLENKNGMGVGMWIKAGMVYAISLFEIPKACKKFSSVIFY